MFTGLIEEVGTVRAIQRGRNSSRITINAERVLCGSKLGDSIAVNGVCLTLDQISGDSFSADIMFTTLAKTDLGRLNNGSPVNLERAMALGERLGGHFVSGHIDGIAEVVSCYENDIAIVLEVQPPPSLMPYIVAQGSVALDGVSLTVASKMADSFSVSLIPHTAKKTILIQKKRKGDILNIETDIIGKYIESLFHRQDTNKKEKKIDAAFLVEHGFI